MEEIGEIETVPAELELEAEPIAVNGEDKNGGKLEQEEERVEDLIEEVEPEEIERDSNNLNGDTTSTAAARDAGDSDQELDELLDESLGEFGKHIPQAKPMQTVTSDPSSSSVASGPTSSAGTDAFDDIFSEEFAAEAEAQLNEAMEMLASENPELWQQFESFAKSMGMEGGGGGGGGDSQSQATPTTTSGATSGGGTSVDEGGGGGRGGDKPRGGPANLDDQLEETLKRLRETTEQIEGGAGAGLGDMFGQLDLGSEEGEDQLMKMMQGMMSTLLSKDVLYPSLKELCKQYPDWLKEHGSEVSPDDLQRYSKQLEIMNTICGEFERQPEGGQATQDSSDKIMQLMQQLQQYGQPPEGLAGDNLQQVGLPPGLLSSTPSSCTLM